MTHPRPTPLGEALLDVLQDASVEETAEALAYAIRHHAIHCELMAGDDATLFWLAAIRSAVDLSEDILGTYIEREQASDADGGPLARLKAAMREAEGAPTALVGPRRRAA